MKNYKLIEEKYLDNEQSDALVYQHKKTKAQIFVMKNDDENKVFGIGFRTPPKKSDGVCHIIEHCVLNGSKKYRTKEPFMDMIKGSLYTFLNAMTYPDKTIYPVASRNDKDFKNLTDLYLDAVFNPRVLEEEKIFRQEGWRYNLEDGKLTYKGVVYNEMRGSMSSQETQVFKNTNAELFPDTIYGLNSGGDPYVIPELTYEQFKEYYSEFYHPSNSYIFLYGNMDHEAYLEYIDKEYLSNYKFRDVNSTLHYQKHFDAVKDNVKYINTARETKPNEAFVSYSAIIGKGNDSKDRIISNILSSALIDNESSSLRQKLLSSGMLDVVFSASTTNLEATFSIIAKNINPKDKDAFVQLIEEELYNISKVGIDKDLILTELNAYKYDLREKGNSATMGMVYFTNALDSWLYDKSPIEAIDINDDLQFIEDNIENGIFEKFIEERILASKNKSIVTHIPQKGLNEEKDAQLQQSLDEKLASLSEEEKKDLENFRIEMETFQNRKNTEEEKATIPMLSKEDVNTQIERIDREVEDRDNYTLLKHNLPTSGIDYISLAFNIDHISSPEDIKYLSLLCSILTMIDTKNYHYSDLNKYIYLNTDGISFSIAQYRDDKADKIYRKLMVTTKTFSENISNATDILAEIIHNTIFENKERIKEIISMINAGNEMNLLHMGHVYMMNRAASNHIEYLKYNELVKGIDFYLFVKELNENMPDDILTKLEEIFHKAFSSNKLIVDLASTFENKKVLENSIDHLVSTLDDTVYEESPFEFTPEAIKEGFATTADVNYVSYGNKLSEEFTGKYIVLNNLVSNEFLYREIRAKGGAYGAGMTTNQVGSFATYSYRDPNLEKTLQTYNGIPNFLEETQITDEDLLPLIIGAVGKLDPPKTERAKAAFDLSFYIGHREYEEIDDLIKNALESDIETLKSKATILKEAIETASLAVLGNSQLINDKKDIFDRIIEL